MERESSVQKQSNGIIIKSETKFLDEDSYERHITLHSMHVKKELLEYTDTYEVADAKCNYNGSNPVTDQKCFMEQTQHLESPCSVVNTDHPYDKNQPDKKVFKKEQEEPNEKPLERDKNQNSPILKNYILIGNPNNTLERKCLKWRKINKTDYYNEQMEDLNIPTIKIKQQPTAITDIGPYKCTLCEHLCKTKSSLTLHMETHTGDKIKQQKTTITDKEPYTCTLCEHLCKTKSSLTLHMKTHTDEILIENKELKTLKSKIQKQETVITEKGLYACTLCEHLCKTKSSLTVHMRTHTDERPLQNAITPTSKFRQQETVIIKKRPYTCTLCGHLCKTTSYLKLHRMTHTGEKPFQCELCPSKFKMRGHLNRHMKVHTGEKPYSCSLCNHKFTQRCTLTKHMKTHTGEKLVSCDLCTYKCSNSNDLNVHRRTHTGERPYACNLCDHRSKTSYSLVTHIRTHTGEKPFSCKICHYKFARSSQLVRHMRTHTGEKRFMCVLCKYKCTRLCNLKKHMMRHGGDRYTCDYCQYTSVDRSEFVLHIKNHEMITDC